MSGKLAGAEGELRLLPDHVHMTIAIPLRHAVSQGVGLCEREERDLSGAGYGGRKNLVDSFSWRRDASALNRDATRTMIRPDF
jgi:REP element-mobilizing transposase RayT